jgi:hypothetical protein
VIICPLLTWTRELNCPVEEVRRLLRLLLACRRAAAAAAAGPAALAAPLLLLPPAIPPVMISAYMTFNLNPLPSGNSMPFRSITAAAAAEGVE